jgi:hypothetical protein
MLYSGLVEYQVDEQRDTAGNSGGIVATIDPSDGSVSAYGLHTFELSDICYAIPLSDLPDSVSVSTGGSEPTDPETQAWVEGVITARDADGIHVRSINAGGESASRTVKILDPESRDVLDSTDVSLAPLGRVDVTLSDPGQETVVLSVGRTEIETTISV